MVQRPHDMPALRHLTAEIGRDLTLTQGPGGNTSVKQDGVLWVKASGTWMMNAETREIFLPLDAAIVRQRLLAGEGDCGATAGLDNTTARASIETPVHAILPHRIVIHVHCVETIRWAILEDGEREIRWRLDGLSWVWIPYRRPGAPLAHAILDRMPANGRPDIYVFQNHGLMIGGDSCESAMAVMREVRRRLAVTPRETEPAAPGRQPPPPSGYHWTDNQHFNRIAFDATAQAIGRGGAMCPDQVMFLGAAYPEVRIDEPVDAAIARWRAIFGDLPSYLVVPESGVLVSDKATPSAIAMLEGLGHVTLRVAADNVAAVRYLATVEIAELTNWDAEILRQKLAVLDVSA